MVEGADPVVPAAPDDGASCSRSADQWLSQAGRLIPTALEQARNARGFAGRWKAITSKLERLPPCLSDLSSHPLFAKNALCAEQLQSVCQSASEAIELATRCGGGGDSARVGKLQMQSDLDSLTGKLDLNLRDCGLLVKTGVLGEALRPSSGPSVPSAEPQAQPPAHSNVRELFARLQIGHPEAKRRAVDGLLEAIKENDKAVLSVLGRNNASALVQLLTAASPLTREKAAAVICSVAESGACDGLLVSEGVLPPLIRLAASCSTAAGREKAVVTLQRLSMSGDTSRLMVAHGGISPLIEICRSGDSISQSAAAGTLKNLSAVAEVRQHLAEEGAIRVMVDLLDRGTVLSAKEYAAQCLQNLTAGNECLRRAVVSEGGVRRLLAYLDDPLPQDSAVCALRNLASSALPSELISMGLLPCLVHVLRAGSSTAQQAAASAICKISGSAEAKKLVGECGCLPLLVSMLAAKTSGAREVAAQALSCLMGHAQNARDVRKDGDAVPNLVRLLDPSPQNAAKKYAVSCLSLLSASKRCRRSMISYGAVGYLKKLSEMDVPGCRKLLERLERGKLRSIFSRK